VKRVSTEWNCITEHAGCQVALSELAQRKNFKALLKKHATDTPSGSGLKPSLSIPSRSRTTSPLRQAQDSAQPERTAVRSWSRCLTLAAAHRIDLEDGLTPATAPGPDVQAAQPIEHVRPVAQQCRSGSRSLHNRSWMTATATDNGGNAWTQTVSGPS
jgi:hypothetical protein